MGRHSGPLGYDPDMGDLVVRELADEDYDGVRRVDELTQRQYLGVTWDDMSDADNRQVSSFKIAKRQSSDWCMG